MRGRGSVTSSAKVARARQAYLAKQAMLSSTVDALRPTKGLVFDHPGDYGHLPRRSVVVKVEGDNVTYQRIKDDGELGLCAVTSIIGFRRMVLRVVEIERTPTVRHRSRALLPS